VRSIGSSTAVKPSTSFNLPSDEPALRAHATMTESLINQITNPADDPVRPGYSRSDLLERIRRTLVELFQLPRERITLEARLLDDLEIDSIDVVDLMEEIRHFTGKKVTVDDFRTVRTVSDLVDVLQRLHS
jgi:acyl carrier protein